MDNISHEGCFLFDSNTITLDINQEQNKAIFSFLDKFPISKEHIEKHYLSVESTSFLIILIFFFKKTPKLKIHFVHQALFHHPLIALLE